MGNLVTCVGMYDGNTLWRHMDLPSHARRHLSVMRLRIYRDIGGTGARIYRRHRGTGATGNTGAGNTGATGEVSMGNLVTCVGMYDGKTLWRHMDLPSQPCVIRLDDSQDLPETWHRSHGQHRSRHSLEAQKIAVSRSHALECMMDRLFGVSVGNQELAVSRSPPS